MTSENGSIHSKQFGEVRQEAVEKLRHQNNKNLANTIETTTASNLSEHHFIEGLITAFPESQEILEQLWEQINEIQKQGKEHYNPDKYFGFRNGKERFIPNLLAKDLEKDYEFKVVRDNERIYVYKDGYYQDIGKDVIEEECDKRLQDKVDPTYQNKVVKIIKRRNKIDRIDFHPPSNKINFKNGVYDLEEEHLEEHSPEYYFTHQIPWEYTEDAETVEIQNFLSGVVRTEQDVKTLREIVGYCMLPDYPIAKAFMLIGKGNNGKSRFLDLLRTVIGGKNTTDKGLQTLEQNRFASSQLEGNLACIDDDLSSDKLYNTDTMKKLTGGSYIDAEIKYGGQYSFKNYAKLVFACNELPQTTDNSDGFYRRWLLIDFPYKFKESPDPDNELEKQGIPKNKLMERITAEEEIKGFIWWAVEALKDVLNNDEFTYAPTIEESRNKWREYSVPIVRFIENYVEQGTTYTEAEQAVENDDQNSISAYDYDYIRKDFLQEVIGDYCEARDHSRPSKKEITRELEKFDFYFNPKGQSRQEPDADRVPVYSGLVLKYPDPDKCQGVKGYSETFTRVTCSIEDSRQSVDTMSKSRNSFDLDNRVRSDVISYIRDHSGDVQDLVENLDYEDGFVEKAVKDMLEEGELYEPESGKVEIL